MSKEQRLHGLRRAKRSYSTFTVKGGSCEEIPLIQGKEQQLRFAGAAVKRYPAAAAAAAKLLQSCPTLCNPIDSLLQGSSVPGILQARTLEWVAISFFNA